MHVEFVQNVTKLNVKSIMALYLKIHEVYKPCVKCHAFIKKCNIICYAALVIILSRNSLNPPIILEIIPTKITLLTKSLCKLAKIPHKFMYKYK